MIKAVNEVRDELAGRVIVACDNQNCFNNWHDIDQHFTCALMAQLIHFEELCHDIIWIPREGLPSVAEFAARLLEATP